MFGNVLPLLALFGGAGALYYYTTRDAKASEGDESGPPSNFVTAMTDDEYHALVVRIQSPRPIVMIKFKPSLGGDAMTAITEAGMAAARAYPQIWVVSALDGIGLPGGDDKVAVGTQCPPEFSGVVVAAPHGGGPDSQVYETCWPAQADADKVKQNINLAAVAAKNLAAQAPNS